MKKIILTTALVLSLATALPAWSNEAHHPESQTGSDTPTVEMTQDKTDSAIMKMEESRQKMEAAQSPTERKALMHEHMQHMQHMKDGMKMMGMMGESSGNHMKMMEDKMEMMMEMMRGMMSQHEMMMK